MIGYQDRNQQQLFILASLEDLIPDDYILKRIEKAVDLSWIREEVKGLYVLDMGRPSIDPEAAFRLVLAGFFLGIVNDRKLMREAHVNIAIPWFSGYALEESLPDHSSLTRIRQRWGEEIFKTCFHKIVHACFEKGMVSAETVSFLEEPFKTKIANSSGHNRILITFSS